MRTPLVSEIRCPRESVVKDTFIDGLTALTSPERLAPRLPEATPQARLPGALAARSLWAAGRQPGHPDTAQPPSAARRSRGGAHRHAITVSRSRRRSDPLT